MRSEKEIFDTVLGFADVDDNVRLVGLNGSRANPEAPRDEFQDYDFAFVVREIRPYLENRNFVDVFGRRLIMQTPEDMELCPPGLGGWFSFLMLFEDHSRIDLMLVPFGDKEKYLSQRLTKVLRDKDGDSSSYPAPSARDYNVRKISGRAYDELDNDFWWLSAYVVKGIRRSEPLYAFDHLSLMRDDALKMLAQLTAAPCDFNIGVGKNYKYLDKYADPTLYARLIATYGALNEDDLKRSFYSLCDLFAQVSRGVALLFGYDYPGYERNMRGYIKEKLN